MDALVFETLLSSLLFSSSHHHLSLGWLPRFDMAVRYCNLCGCPLAFCSLRALSTAQRGDNPGLLWDDTCSCKGDSSDSDSDIEAGHAYWCQYLLGYDGNKLSQADIEVGLRCKVQVQKH